MNRIKKSIKISAPLEKVFEYFSDPQNLPEIWPSLVEVKNFVNDAAEFSFDYVYKMAGVKFEGHAQTLEFEPNERIMTQSRKGIRNVIVYYFEQSADKTKVTIDTEYEIPSLLLIKLADPVVQRMNERDITTLLNNLKDRMELAAGISEAAPTQGTTPFVVH